MFELKLDNQSHQLSVAARSPELTLLVDNKAYAVSEAGALDDSGALITVAGRTYQVWRTREGDRIHLRIGQRTFSVGYEDAITAAQHHAGGDDVLRADMPGTVVSADCTAGQDVSMGDVLMVIESMKMQINIVAPRDGKIELIHLEANQTFDKGAELVTLHAED